MSELKRLLLSLLMPAGVCMAVYVCMCLCGRVLCGTVKQLVARLAAASRDDDPLSVSSKCSVLNQKLDALIRTLHEESHAATSQHVGDLSVCHTPHHGM